MDKIKELREANEAWRLASENMRTCPCREHAEDESAARRLFEKRAGRYVRSILNSPDEAAVERAARAIGEGRRMRCGGYPCDGNGPDPWLTDEDREAARAALTAALGVAAPDGGRS